MRTSKYVTVPLIPFVSWCNSWWKSFCSEKLSVTPRRQLWRVRWYLADFFLFMRAHRFSACVFPDSISKYVQYNIRSLNLLPLGCGQDPKLDCGEERGPGTSHSAGCKQDCSCQRQNSKPPGFKGKEESLKKKFAKKDFFSVHNQHDVNWEQAAARSALSECSCKTESSWRRDDFR